MLLPGGCDISKGVTGGVGLSCKAMQESGDFAACEGVIWRESGRVFASGDLVGVHPGDGFVLVFVDDIFKRVRGCIWLSPHSPYVQGGVAPVRRDIRRKTG